MQRGATIKVTIPSSLTYRQLAGLLRDARIRAGLTQKDVAEAVKVSRETIHSLETARPKRPVDADLANNLARVLPGVTVLHRRRVARVGCLMPWT